MALFCPEIYLEPFDENGNFKSIWHVLGQYEDSYKDPNVWDKMVRDVAIFDEENEIWSDDYVLSQLVGMRKVEQKPEKTSIIHKLAVCMMERTYLRMEYIIKQKGQEQPK